MPKFKVKVSDTITYERIATVSVQADDAASAVSRAIQMALNGEIELEWGEQVTSTPYDAEVVSGPTPLTEQERKEIERINWKHNYPE